MADAEQGVSTGAEDWRLRLISGVKNKCGMVK